MRGPTLMNREMHAACSAPNVCLVGLKPTKKSTNNLKVPFPVYYFGVLQKGKQRGQKQPRLACPSLGAALAACSRLTSRLPRTACIVKQNNSSCMRS